MNITKQVEELKIVPVVVLHEAENANPLAEALISGGLPIAEITFRTEAAAESIELISKRFPEMLVGAGTITNIEQAAKAISVGAKFIVTPGFNRKVTEYVIEQKVPIFPGACTPTELMLLLEYNLNIAKFFPASQFGGLDTIKALAAPFPGMRFMPTGGINTANIMEYLEYSKVIACGGSWMVKESLIKDGKFDEIRKITMDAIAIIHE